MRLVLVARKAWFENGIESSHPSATQKSRASAIGAVGRADEALDAALVALYARLERAERDTKRLDWLLNELSFDELAGGDVHVEALRVSGGVEPTTRHYRTAYRNLIDTASENTR